MNFSSTPGQRVLGSDGVEIHTFAAGISLRPNENQDFGEEKFKELDSDQIEGGEFEFLGLEIRFERNREIEFVEIDFEF